MRTVAARPTTKRPFTAIGHGVPESNIAFHVSSDWHKRATAAMDMPCSLSALESRRLLHSSSCLYPPIDKPSTFTCTPMPRPIRHDSEPPDGALGDTAVGGGVTSEAAPAPL